MSTTVPESFHALLNGPTVTSLADKCQYIVDRNQCQDIVDMTLSHSINQVNCVH